MITPGRYLLQGTASKSLVFALYTGAYWVLDSGEELSADKLSGLFEIVEPASVLLSRIEESRTQSYIKTRLVLSLKRILRLINSFDTGISASAQQAMLQKIYEAATGALNTLYSNTAKTMPDAEGFYWGIWRIKAEGTRDEEESPGSEWEVMRVMHNGDPDNEFIVLVPGVEQWQPLENFHWGQKVESA